MTKTRKFFRSFRALSIENKTKPFVPELLLECGQKEVTGIAATQNCAMIAVSTYYKNIYIFDFPTQGEPIRIFEKNVGEVTGLVHLHDGIMASVDNTGMLLTWRARSGAILDQLKVSECRCSAIKKAGATEILIGTSDGEIFIVVHGNGWNLTGNKRCKGENNATITTISVYKDILVAVSGKGPLGKGLVWDFLSGNLLHTIESR